MFEPTEPIVTNDYWTSSRDTGSWARQALLDHVVTALSETGHRLRDLTAIIVAGAMFEYYLRELIRPRVDLLLLEPSNVAEPIPFVTMVRIARSLQVLPEHLYRPLIKFAQLRNEFAHNIEKTLTDDDISPLDKTLNASLRDQVEELKDSAMAKKRDFDECGAYVRLFIAWLTDEIEDIMRQRKADAE